MKQLRLATNDEKRRRDELCWQAWGQGLSVAQFVAREEQLRAHVWSREAMRTWLWVDGDDVLSSCETFRINVAKAQGGASAHVEGVASVFTEESLRKRGHSTAMLSALLERLRGETGCVGSVLFSDVGAPIYERNGYVAVPAPVDAVFTPAAGAPNVEWLDELHEVRPPSVPDGTLVLHPSLEQLSWHVERERIYQGVLGRIPLRARGARVGASTMQWAALHKKRELVVLWAELHDEGHRAPLIAAARAVAHEAGLERVCVWNGEPYVRVAGATLTPRDGELPMFASFDPALKTWAEVPRALWL